MTAMRLKRYPSPSGGIALGKMGVGATLLKQGKTARDYVQSGLEIHLDGIENYSYGDHSTTLTYWRDLISGYETDASMIPSGDDAMKFSLSNKSLYFFNTVNLPLDVRQKFANGYTFEMVAEADDINPSDGILCRLYDGTNFFSVFASGSVVNATSAGVSSGNLQRHNSGIVALVATYDPVQNVAAVYRDGAIVTSNVPSYAVGTLSYIAKRATNSVLNYHAIRLYSRALTADEIAANYAIDQERFNLP